MDISEKVGCYKTTLVCADHNVKFYERCGFVRGQNEMVRSSFPLSLGLEGLTLGIESVLREEGATTADQSESVGDVQRSRGQELVSGS